MEVSQQRTDIEQKFLELCLQVVSDLSLEVYDLEFVPSQSILRIYVQNPETKSAVIEDCVKVDHALTEHIENLDWMPPELTLEVSSPGMFRDLREKKHFELVQGEMIELVLLKSLEEVVEKELPKRLRKQKKVRLKLEKVTDEFLSLTDENEHFDINFNIIKKAKLSPPWN